MPNDNEMVKGKIYAVVDGEYREVMELQGEITLHECDEQLWQYDYVRVVRCKDCEYADKEVYQNNEMWLCRCRKYSQVVEANDFCSYGERRSDETE